MFSGIMSSVAMCRAALREGMGTMGPPTRFVRRPRPQDTQRTINTIQSHIDPPETTASESIFYSKIDSKLSSDPWQEYTEALLYGGETLSQSNTTHRDHALLSRYGKHGVVAPWSPSGWVDEEVDGLIRYWGRRQLSEHDIQIDRAEDLLQRVEGEPTQFALDEVGAILHDSLQLDVPVPALPPRDEVQHVGALSCLAVLPAGVAGEGDAQCGEEREVGGLVPHSEQAREEVDLACDCGDGQEAGGPHDEEGEYCLVGEIFEKQYITLCSR